MKTQLSYEAFQQELRHFTGTENWYRHGLARAVTYTDGVKFVAENCGAYWLIDEIALSNMTEKKLKMEEFQVWKFVVNVEKGTGVLTCEDGNDKNVYSKKITFTDFPYPEIKFFFTGNVIMLPSEY